MMMEIKYTVFIIFFIFFFFEDFRKHSVDNIVFIMYLSIGIILMAIGLYDNYIKINSIDYNKILEILLSFMLGGLIYLLSIASNEAIGKGDAIYFIINGLYLTFIENALLFVLGIFASTLISIFIYIKNKGKVNNVMIPFIPCLLPTIVWRIICIL